MIAIMPQAGKNKGNKNAALKSGEIGRIQWTQSLSGGTLQRFIRYLELDSLSLTDQEIKEKVVSEGRRLFEEMIEERGKLSDT